MPLCLLSRRLQRLGSSAFTACFRLSKVMNPLLFDLISFDSRWATSQPNQQKSRYESTSPLCVLTKLFRGWRRRAKDPLVVLVASSFPTDQSFQSASTAPDAICLICGSHRSMSCPVCEQDFCSIHLYTCLDCGSQYCSRCLDDHRVEGHWTDSDTAAELNHGWRVSSILACLLIGNHCASYETYLSQTTACTSRTRITGSVVLPAQRASDEQSAGQAHSSAILEAARNQPSSRFLQGVALRFLASEFARVFRAVRLCLSWWGARELGNVSSQSLHYPEVRL